MHRVSEAHTNPSPPPAPGTPLWRRALLIALAAATAAGFGLLTLWLQEHYAADQARGDTLNPITGLLADGSGVRTVWIGYAAALLFIGAVLRLVLGPEEPPVGGSEQTVTAMRAAFRAEYQLIRRAQIAVLGVALLDVGRTGVYLVAGATGHQVARDDVGWVAAEALGLVVSAAGLRLWVVLFRRQLDRVGAL